MHGFKTVAFFLPLLGVSAFLRAAPAAAGDPAVRAAVSVERPVVLRRIVSSVLPDQALQAINANVQKALEKEIVFYTQIELVKASRPNAIERLQSADDPTDARCFKNGFCVQQLPSPGVGVRPGLLIGGSILQYAGKLAVSLYLFDLATREVAGVSVAEIDDPREPPAKPSPKPAPIDNALLGQLVSAVKRCAVELVEKNRYAFKAAGQGAVTGRNPEDRARPFDLAKLLALDAARIDEVRNDPGMRLIAISFAFPGQNPDSAVSAAWKNLKQDYGRYGLRNVLVRIAFDNAPCDESAWPADRDVCVPHQAISGAWPYRRSPGTFLVDWQGNLLAHGLTWQEAEIRIRLYYAQTPQVVLLPPEDHRGVPIAKGDARRLSAAVSDFFAQNHRLELAPSATALAETGPVPGGSGGAVVEPCAPTERSAPVYYLRMVHDRSSRNEPRLTAVLLSAKRSCIAASSEAPVVGRKIGEAARLAMMELVAQLAHSPLQENGLKARRPDSESIPLEMLPVYDVLARNAMFLQRASDEATAANERAAMLAASLEKTRGTYALEKERRKAAEERQQQEKEERLAEFWRTKEFTIATRAEFAHYFDHFKIFQAGIKSREAIRVLITFTMGSGSFGFDVEPAYTYEWVSDKRFTNYQLLGVDAHAYIKFVLGKKVYATLSAGLIGGYMLGGGVDWGIEGYAHVPYAMNVCLSKKVALEFLVAVGYGITGMVDNLTRTMSDEARNMAVDRCVAEQGLPRAECTKLVGTTEKKTDTVLGHGLLLEAAMGLRFP